MRGHTLDRCRIFSEQIWRQYVVNYLTNTALRFSPVMRDNRDFTKAFAVFIIANANEDKCVFGDGGHRQFVWADGRQIVGNGFDGNDFHNLYSLCNRSLAETIAKPGPV